MQHAECIIIFNTSGKFLPVSNFTELHTLNLAARSYALLVWLIASEVSNEENLFSEEVI